MKEHLRVLAQIHDTPWAITDAALQQLAAIVERPTADIEAVASRLGRPLENTGGRVEQRGSIAVINIEGPIFRYANLFTAISGATSIEKLATDLQVSLDSASVEHILLNIDSPGGQLEGTLEFADQVHRANKVKPVTAYIDGNGASAAYWIASGSKKVIASEAAFVGSIGVVATISDRRAAQERQGVRTYEIVSSQSPRKRPDVATEEGRGQIQLLVDAAADLFIARVAAFRGVTAEKVLADFGQGGMFLGRPAKDAGLVDEISSFEAVLRRLDADVTRRLFLSAETTLKEETMPDPNEPKAPPAAAAPSAPPPAAPAPNPPAAAAPAPDLAAAERLRVRSILECAEAKGREGLARVIACDTDHDLATAQRLLLASPLAAAETAAQSPLDREMGKLKNPAVGTGAGGDAVTAADEANSILMFIPKHRRVAS